jgi:phage-related protein
MKEIKWNLKARDFIKSLDNETKREIGTLLMMLQSGIKLSEPQSKPMKIIHKNAFELRIKDRHGVYRVIYILNIGDKILIPHAFTKKTQKTPKKEIDLSIKRLQELINETGS